MHLLIMMLFPRTMESNISETEGAYSAIEKLEIGWNYVGTELEVERVDSFRKSFNRLIDTPQE